MQKDRENERTNSEKSTRRMERQRAGRPIRPITDGPIYSSLESILPTFIISSSRKISKASVD